MSLGEFLTRVVRILDSTGVPYMLTGSLAAAYFATPRATQDIDFVIDADAPRIDRLVDALLDAGFYVSRDAAHSALESASQFNAIDPETGWKVDLIVRKGRLYSVTEFGRRKPAHVLGVEVSLTSIEDLIIAKLEWSQLGDSDLQRRDVAQLLEAGWDSIDQAYVKRWVENLGLQVAWRDALARLRGREGGSQP